MWRILYMWFSGSFSAFLRGCYWLMINLIKMNKLKKKPWMWKRALCWSILQVLGWSTPEIDGRSSPTVSIRLIPESNYQFFTVYTASYITFSHFFSLFPSCLIPSPAPILFPPLSIGSLKHLSFSMLVLCHYFPLFSVEDCLRCLFFVPMNN